MRPEIHLPMLLDVMRGGQLQQSAKERRIPGALLIARPMIQQHVAVKPIPGFFLL